MFLVAAVPGALLGALLLRVISNGAVAVMIAVAVGMAGVAELLGLPRSPTRESAVRRGAVNGLITGIGSALTGTSGPLIGMPLLAWSGTSIVERIHVAQVAQLPIAATAALVFGLAGDVAWAVAASSAVALSLGTAGGMRLTSSMAPITLRRTTAALMVTSALSVLATAVF